MGCGQNMVPRFLFLLTVLVSLGLAGAVFVAPIIELDPSDGLWSDLQAMFALDLAVRRTAVASAIGLLVTAWVFFRPRGVAAETTRKKHRPPPANIAGA